MHVFPMTKNISPLVQRNTSVLLLKLWSNEKCKPLCSPRTTEEKSAFEDQQVIHTHVKT